MEAQRSTNFNEFYKSTGEHSINIRVEECFDKMLYHINSRILKCKMTNVITMAEMIYTRHSLKNMNQMKFLPWRSSAVGVSGNAP
jgi:hypothetical protein